MNKNFVKSLGEVALSSRIRQFNEKLYSEGVLVYKKLGINFEPKYFLIFMLLKKHGSLTIGDMSAETGLTQPAITQLINSLYKKKLVSFKKDMDDSRKKIVSLSLSGKALLKKLLPVWKSFDLTIKQLFKESGVNLLKNIEIIETHFEKKSLHIRILNNLKK